jgi:hypothetical protein
MKKVNQWDVAQQILDDIELLGPNPTPQAKIRIYIRHGIEADRSWSTVKYWVYVLQAFPPGVRKEGVAFTAHQAFLMLPPEVRYIYFNMRDEWTVDEANRFVESCREFDEYESPISWYVVDNLDGLSLSEVAELEAEAKRETCPLQIGMKYSFKGYAGCYKDRDKVTYQISSATFISSEWKDKYYYLTFEVAPGATLVMQTSVSDCSRRFSALTEPSNKAMVLE